MNCRRVRKSLMDYADGRLSGTRREEVGLHLESCPDCMALAQRLQISDSALSRLTPVEMPQEAAHRVLSALKPQDGSAPVLGFLRSPRALAVAGGAAAVLVAAAVVVGIFTLGGPGKKPGQSGKIQQTLATGEAERSVSSTDKFALTAPSAPAEGLVLPVARMTGNNYDQESAKVMAENCEVKNRFAEKYSMTDAVNLRTVFTEKLADDFSALGGDGAMLEAMISYIQSTEPVLLPCYAEEAIFSGKNVYIIGLCGPSGSGKVKMLIRTEFWALCPQEFSTNPDASLAWWGQSIKQ